MDYRNADGSIAQMCGNGVRVFAHYLRASGLESRDEFVVGSLAGPRPVVVHHVDDRRRRGHRRDGQGQPARHRDRPTVGGRQFTGLGVDVGNPHLACVDPDLTDGGAGRPRRRARRCEFDRGQFPDGVNVEVLTAPVDGAVSMRVHERGVGETRSCGTGTVAAAVAALAPPGRDDRHAAGADPRRRGQRRDHRHHQLPARTVGAGRARRDRRRLVGGAALITTRGRYSRCATLSVRDTIEYRS